MKRKTTSKADVQPPPAAAASPVPNAPRPGTPTATASAPASLRALTEQIRTEEAQLREGGGPAGVERQRRLNRLTVRERVGLLEDEGIPFLELGLWAGHRMYESWGDTPGAGVVTGIITVHGRSCMVIANDATVKAGAFFPQTAKKVLRAQKIAYRCNLPLIYLVDSSGVFLPLQDEIFPDEDDFGRIFRNNAVLSAAGVPQIAAIMGNCVAGGAYLPVLCDKILMTEGSALYLAGPALVKAAIGQEVDAESLGGARMHAEISGTIDFREADDVKCIQRIRELVKLLPATEGTPVNGVVAPAQKPEVIYDRFPGAAHGEYDMLKVLECIVDAGSLNEYKADYGKTLITAYAAIGGRKVGIVANQRTRQKSKRGEIQMGGVIYAESADKAARFVMDCNQSQLPLVFLQDVMGFMVGRDAEQAGIIRSGAKLVNAVSNSTSPKITIVVGGSFGAGNYALCGKAFDPAFIFAWPGARYAVMGGDQAAETLLSLQRRQKQEISPEELEAMRQRTRADYHAKTDIRYGAARGWVDGIIAPETTRDVLIQTLKLVTRPPPAGGFRGGVLQV